MEYAVGCKQNSLERKDELVKMQLAMAVKADRFRNMGSAFPSKRRCTRKLRKGMQLGCRLWI